MWEWLWDWCGADFLSGGQTLSFLFQLKHLQPIIRLSIVLFSKGFSYFEKSKPMRLKFLEILCW